MSNYRKLNRGSDSEGSEYAPTAPVEPPPKRGRGRPRKNDPYTINKVREWEFFTISISQINRNVDEWRWMYFLSDENHAFNNEVEAKGKRTAEEI